MLPANGGRGKEGGEEERMSARSLYFQKGEIRCDVRVRQLDSACVIKGPSPVWRGREGRKGRRGLQSEGRNGNDSEQRTPGNGASRLGGQSAGKSRPFGASVLEWCSTNRSLPGPPFTPLLVSHMNIQSRPTDRQVRSAFAPPNIQFRSTNILDSWSPPIRA